MNKTISKNELRALNFIRNCLFHRHQYPSLREIAKELGYASPNSAAFVVNNLIKSGYLTRRDNRGLQLIDVPPPANSQTMRTTPVPIVGTVPCGSPMFAEENIEGWISVSQSWLKPHYQYFLLRATGDSMDRSGIEEGSLLLVRQQNIAESGDVVVALIDDAATVKIFERKNNLILLKPNSTSSRHQPIFLDDDAVIQGKVEKVLPAI